MTRIPALAAIAAVCVGVTAPVQAQTPSQPVKNVLAIHWGPEGFPSSQPINDAIRQVLSSDHFAVDYFVEHLESDRFAPADAAAALVAAIRTKHRDRHIDLVFAIADPALQFALEHRDELFPGAPIVFSGVGAPDEKARTADGGTTAVMRGASYAETVRFALSLHPSADQMFIVAKSRDAAVSESTRALLAGFPEHPRLTFVSPPTVGDLLTKVRSLPPESVLLYLTFAPDESTPLRDDNIIQLVAQASSVPVYVANERYIGSGVVGGVVRDIRQTARRMGEMGIQILKGTRAQDIPIENASLLPTVDWRQLQRWKIDDALLPSHTTVQFRGPSLWLDYRTEVLWTTAAVLLQLGLIVGLLYERRERRRAEAQSREHMAVATHVGRQLAMGELSASMAHELNQPLSSILYNAEAADKLLATNRATFDDLRDIVRDIRSEDMRASEIIRRQRSMIQRHEFERSRLDLNAVVRESLAIVAHDAEIRRVRIETDLSTSICSVTGDQILLQQVVLNLLLNGMDAMTQTPLPRRRLTVRTTKIRELVEISVRDAGGGIAPEVAPRLFEPFVTTKATGMGIGLTIVRSIVETHGGAVEARNNAEGGATFRFTLPCHA